MKDAPAAGPASEVGWAPGQCPDALVTEEPSSIFLGQLLTHKDVLAV